MLDGVDATSATNAWAVGDYFNGSSETHLDGALERHALESPAEPEPPGLFRPPPPCVAATYATNAEAVGHHYGGTTDHTLALPFCWRTAKTESRREPGRVPRRP